MPESYIVRFNDSCTDDDYSKAKEDVKTQGGNIKHEYTLFKGFTAELPDHHVTTLSSHPHVDQVEKDQEVSILSNS